MSSSWPGGRSAERVADALALSILGVVAIIAALTFRDYGLGWDDYTHAEYGGLLLDLYASGFSDQRALSFVNLYAYGGGFDMLSALAAKVLPFDLFETRRLVGAVIGLIGIFITWRLARRVGGPLAALIAVALLATCPLYYGNMFMNAKDAPFAVAMVFLTLALVRAFEEYPRPSPITCAMVGIGAGLAIGTRVLGGLAAINALAALALVFAVETRRAGLREAGPRLGAFTVRFVPALLVGYAVMALVWPWSVTEPLNPFRAVEYFSHFFEKPWKEMFDGMALPVPEMPRQYVPQLFLLKEPEIFLALGIAGTAGALVAALRRDIATSRRAIYLLLAFAGVFPIALAVLTKPAMYNGIRHFVFVAPALAVLGGLAGAWIGASAVAAVAAGGRTCGRGAPGRPVPAGERDGEAASLSVHPFQRHRRRHSRRRRSLHARLLGPLLQTGGAGVAGAADGRIADPDRRAALAGRRSADRCGRRRSSWGRNSSPPGTPGAPISPSPWASSTAPTSPAPVMVEIEREGVVYARVYDIRGRTFTSLNAIQP